MSRRTVNNLLWGVFSIFILIFLLQAILTEALELGGYFLVMFIVTLVFYVWQGKFYRLIENPFRIVILFVVQVVIFSLGSLLVEAKESLFQGSILTALILLGTYLYLRSEVTKLRGM